MKSFVNNTDTKKVLMPKWWCDGKKIIGYSDCVDTYCCDTQPAWFVEVPSEGYEGYFLKKDLIVLK